MKKLFFYFGFILFMLFSVPVFSQLNAEFFAPVSEGCNPLIVNFKDNSTGSPDRWFWEISDGRTSDRKDPSFLYLTPGTYTVKLTVYKGLTSVSTITKIDFVKVYDIPIVAFQGDNLQGCIPLAVNFANGSIPGSGTIASSLWDFGDGNTKMDLNPMHTYKTTGKYNVTLTVVNSFGCKSSLSIPNYIKVNDSINANFKFSIIPSCGSPFPVQFSDTSIGKNIVSWKWDFGDGTTSNVQNPTKDFTNIGTYNVRLIVQNVQGCSDTITKPVSITLNNYAAKFTSLDTSCRGPLIQFTNQSTPSAFIDSVFWDFGDGSISKALSPKKGYQTPGTYTVKLTTYFGACSVSYTKQVVILSGPASSFTGTPLTACKPPLTVSFTSSVTNGSAFRFNLGNGVNSPSANPTTTYTSIGNYSVQLISLGTNGCYDTLVKPNYVKIKAPEIEDISGLPYSGCFPWTHTFNAKVDNTNPIVSWEWDFGDGRTSNLQKPTITYSVRGEYTVTLKITTDNGCTSTFSSTVKGGIKPQINFTADKFVVCPEDVVIFTGIISGLYDSLRYTFGDGGSSILKDPAYVYKDTGDMDVTLFVYDMGCYDSLLIKKYIYVNPPIAKFNIAFDCNNKFQREFRDSSIGGTNWKWYFGNGDSSSLRSPVYNYPDTGTYKVTLTVNDSLCRHSLTQTVMVIDLVADFVYTQSGSCDSTMAIFTAQGPKVIPAYISSYIWRFSDGGSFNGTSKVISRVFNKPSNLKLQLSIFDLNNCRANTSKDLNILLSGPKARILPLFKIICAGQEATFADTSLRQPSNPIVKWRWNFGDGTDTTFLAPPFKHVYKDTGTYDLKLIVEDINGCIDSIIVKKGIRVLSPNVKFSSLDTVVCTYTDVNFINESNGTGLKYKWYFGNGDSSTLFQPVVQFQNIGKYNVSLQVTDTAGCVAELLRPDYIDVGGALAKFTMSDSAASCPPLQVNFTNNTVGAIGYKWDFGNGNSSILSNPSQTYVETGTFHARLVTTGKGGCTDTLIKTVSIRGPKGKLTYTPLSGCPPFEVTFISEATNVQTFIWDFSDGQTEIGTDSTTKHIYLTPGTYRPRVILEDGQNCKVSVLGKEEIKIVGVRSLISELTTYSYCDSAFISFSDSSITNDNIKKYRWDFGDGDTSDLPNPQHQYKTSGRYTVSLYVETADNCSSYSILPADIDVAISPHIDMHMDTTFCLPGNILFTPALPTGDTTGLVWIWDFGNGDSSFVQYPDTVLYNVKGTYFPGLVIKNASGCSDTASGRVVVNDGAQAYIVDIGNYLFCNSGTVAFKDSTTNDSIITKWLWDFGDGNSSNLRNPIYTYTQPGRYKPSLAVETDQNCVTIDILPGEIIVAPSPKYDIGADTAICSSSSVQFSGTWINPDSTTVTWFWEFGNGDTSTFNNPLPVHYAQPGQYLARLITSNDYDCRDTVYRNILVKSQPPVNISGFDPGFFCDSASIGFKGSVNDTIPIRDWLWDFGDGSTSSLQNPVHFYNTPGIYSVHLSINTVENCPSATQSSNDILISQSPKFNIGPDTVFCIPASINFKANWLNPDSTTIRYFWNFGNGQSDTASSPQNVLYNLSGNYQVNMVATNQFGCTDSVFKNLTASNIAKLNLSQFAPICQGSSVNLFASGSDTIVWKSYPTLSCTNCTNPVATPASSQYYQVTGKNIGGCSVTDSVKVVVVLQSKLNDMMGDSICIGKSVRLNASGGFTYNWSPATGLSSVNIPNPLASPVVPTNYRVITSDSLGCFSDTGYVFIDVFPLPTVNIIASEIKEYVGTKVTLSTQSANAVKWRWTPSTGLDCISCPEPTLTVSQVTKYKVTATNQGGCEAQDEVTVTPLCAAGEIFMPNTFSPNGDGRNDSFYPMGIGISSVKTLKIFNRWGEAVFEKNNFMANDPSAGWDGMYKGKPVSSDVYVWVMVVLCFNNEKTELKGNVTLIK